MTDKEKAKAEIERRVKFHAESSDPLASAYVSEDNAILSFIDSLQEEPVSEDLDMEIDYYLRELQSFKSEHGIDCYTVSIEDMDEICRHFANWQKEQMMAKAVEGGCFSYKNGFVHISCDIDEHLTDIKIGDKVKLIIVKEN